MKKIRIIKKNVRREDTDGDLIRFPETGEVPDGIAEALVARGHAEVVSSPDTGVAEGSGSDSLRDQSKGEETE